MTDESSRQTKNERREVVWSRFLARPTQFVMDLAVLVTSLIVAYYVRFEFVLSADQWQRLLAQMPLVVLIQLAALALSGVYSFIWRYVGMSELWAFLRAAFWSGSILLLGRLALPDFLELWRVPLSIIFMTSVFSFSGVVALRVTRRALYERFEKSKVLGDPSSRKPVLLVGAGRAGVLAAREIRGRGDMDVWIEGFVDDDERKHGAVIQGERVLGQTRDLPRLCREFEIDHVIITMAQVARKEIRRIVEICEQIPVKVRIIPGFYEILEGKVDIARFRDVQIEDVLGREPVKLEEDSVATFLSSKTVLVTGAGGSIGSELAKQVARFEPACLVLLDRAEFALFEIDRHLRATSPQFQLEAVVADVCDEGRMRRVFADHRPEVILHAAAHKHVPLMESNPSEGIKNNVLGTLTPGRLAAEFDAEAFVLISTDKAVRPTSVMGASKRVAELTVQELDSTEGTRFLAVRFGNVLGSAGSVIPIFREQILAGGPLTVTHPDMVRYFMTIPEAAQLVLQAGAMGEGGEIFVLEMGDPVRILDLATDMITLSGLKPYEDVDIVYTGLRPGEKLFEELHTTGEGVAKTRHPKILIGKIEGKPSSEIQSALERLQELSVDGDGAAVRRFLDDFLPEAQLSS